jgi:hypothetical protein
MLDWHSGLPFSIQDPYGQLAGSVDGHRFRQFFELNLFLERQLSVRGFRVAFRVGFNNITAHIRTWWTMCWVRRHFCANMVAGRSL